MTITLSHSEIREIIQDYYDNAGTEILIEHVFCEPEKSSGHVRNVEFIFSLKSEVLKHASK